MSSAPHMRISLDKLVFSGYHGLYAEEKKLGNTYIVDVLIISLLRNLLLTI
jgi:dihydroneopterin aldolase